MIAGYILSVLGAFAAAAALATNGLGLIAAVLGYVVTGGSILVAFGAMRAGTEHSA